MIHQSSTSTAEAATIGLRDRSTESAAPPKNFPLLTGLGLLRLDHSETYITLDFTLLAPRMDIHESEVGSFSVGRLNRHDSLVIFGSDLQLGNRARVFIALQLFAFV